MKNLFKSFLAFTSIVVLTTSCLIAPVSTNYESARSLKKNNIEATGSFTSNSGGIDGESDPYNRNFGFRVGYGITDKFDAKLGYERCIPVWGEEADNLPSVNFFSLSPKYTFIDNVFAVKLPINLYSFKDGESEMYFAINPTLLGTLPVSDKFEVGLSTAYQIIFYEEEALDFLSFALGFGISSDLNRWALRPEIGYQFDPEDSDISFFNFGLGFSYNFDLNK
jgi:hypothetical protein